MLYLVRHGQTAYNTERRLQGQLDIPLDERGREQAAELAERLKNEGPRVNKIYCSTLRRAGETARIIGRRLGLTPVSIEGIEEIAFGCFQGHTFDECARLFPEKYADYLIFGSASTAHGGESGRQVLARSREALLKLPEAHSGSALTVAHGAVIGYLRAASLGLPLDDISALIPDNAEVIPFGEDELERLGAYVL